MPQRLASAIDNALRAYRETLSREKKMVKPLLVNLKNGGAAEVAEAAGELIEMIGVGGEMPAFSLTQIQIWQNVLGTSRYDAERKRSASEPGLQPQSNAAVKEELPQDAVEQTISV
ncbi:MAG: hypothetical protein H0U23_17210 [Blastocatellia bacterium]|nr:hypothetical protein [Blastocatellia bacterium]